jgi:hypothetical protein
MDLLDFGAEAMPFDEPLDAQAQRLIEEAAEKIGEDAAEQSLLGAYLLESEHLTVLVALYRFVYYRWRYADCLRVAEHAVAVTAGRLGLAADWRAITQDDFALAAQVSTTKARFLPIALEGAGYLKLRLEDPVGALACFEKMAELDSNDRPGTAELLRMARARASAEQALEAVASVTVIRR